MHSAPVKRTAKGKQTDLSLVPAEVRELITDEVLQKMPEPKITQLVERYQMFSGPLPPPDLLEKYGDVRSDFPERITRMAEDHNRADVLTKNRFSFAMSFATIAGPIFSFLLGASAIAAGVWLAIIGESGASIASILGGFAPIIIAALANLKQK